MADALLTLEPDSLRLDLDPLHWAICREWLPQGSFRMPIRITPLRVMAAFTAMTTLLMTFATQRVPGDERPPSSKRVRSSRRPLICRRPIQNH